MMTNRRNRPVAAGRSQRSRLSWISLNGLAWRYRDPTNPASLGLLKETITLARSFGHASAAAIGCSLHIDSCVELCQDSELATYTRIWALGLTLCLLLN